MLFLAKLDATIRAVCPIHGISIGRWNDKTTWRIDFKDEATAEQRAAAQVRLDAFDVATANSNAAIFVRLAEIDRLAGGGRGLRELAIAFSDLVEGLRATDHPEFPSTADNVGILKVKQLEAEAATLRASLVIE